MTLKIPICLTSGELSIRQMMSEVLHEVSSRLQEADLADRHDEIDGVVVLAAAEAACQVGVRMSVGPSSHR